MLESFPFCLLMGTAFGFLAGLGVGGGSLLMLWLTTVLTFSQPQARILNLLFFIPSAVIASFFHRKQGALPLKKLLPAILAGSITGAVFSLLSRQLELALLEKLFGVLLLLTGVRELLYKPKTSR